MQRNAEIVSVRKAVSSTKAQQIIEILKKEDGLWLSRAELAVRLMRGRLSNQDLETLTVLEKAGAIEVDRRPDPRPSGHVYYYRFNEVHAISKEQS